MARQRFTRHITLHGAAQVRDLLAVNQLHLRQCIGRIGVAGGGNKAGQVRHGAKLGKVHF